MLYKTKAIALNYIKYKDTSIIAKIYTEQFGLQSYIVNRVRTKSSKLKMALFQPFTLLDLVVYHNEKKDIQRISEMKAADLLHRLPFDIRKSSIALFLTEILVKILREEQTDEEQFAFLYRSALALDQTEEGVNHFHLQFLLKFGRHLGITPPTSKELVAEIAHYQRNTSPEIEEKLQELLVKNYSENIVLRKSEKQYCIDSILTFYALHFENLRKLKSLSVLQEVLN